ncbi:hypothetical protein GCM10022243_65340 [Saccharothrix violaceirubra]|uniref:Uncharacterized protein n=1 Tax=Saccharothrix violaceirubra TaxID=413306 RepID=A0A7W7T9I0_9PSEU|nr:hypothetical protein [Saccharothrix violaceirubra]MBB4968980.1 hypothetical protein [Saccharothrix violaceirubra]
MSETITWSPLCGETEFAELLNGLAVDFAPRLFAVVHEYRDRADGWIAAWGMAFPQHADVISVDGGLRLRLAEPDGAVRVFTSEAADVTARLVWLPAFNPRLEEPVESYDEDPLDE